MFESKAAFGADATDDDIENYKELGKLCVVPSAWDSELDKHLQNPSGDAFICRGRANTNITRGDLATILPNVQLPSNGWLNKRVVESFFHILANDPMTSINAVCIMDVTEEPIREKSSLAGFFDHNVIVFPIFNAGAEH
jgi:hypothetical protein